MAQSLSGMTRTENDTRKKDLVITRRFNAPRSLVWRAWTEPGLVMRWWGPKGFTAPVAKIDFRVGGKYLNAMRSPEGKDFWSTGTYLEIVPEERFVATDSFSDEKGNVVPASYYGMTDPFPLELRVTVTLTVEKGATTMTLRHEGMPPGEQSEMAKAGWNESFDKLDAVLEEEKSGRAKTLVIAEPGRQEASIVRVFDAPPERLFKAFTDPKLMALWWAPRRYSIVVEAMEARPGGSWRILNRDADGEYWFHGVYHQVSDKRIVYTFEFEGMPGHVLLGIVTFEDLNGRTKLTEKSIFESVEDRDGMMKSGMEDSGPEIMDRLADLVEKGGTAEFVSRRL